MTPLRKIRPWSISTTVRNPARNAEFLQVLHDHFTGRRWDEAAQVDYQVRLIQKRLFGAFNPQFYSGLGSSMIGLIEGDSDISHDEAREIFAAKEYEDPGMRGRTSFKPLQKLGFANIVDGRVKITDAGQALLAGTEDDGDLFLRSLLKWQLPNVLDKTGFPASSGYALKPFVSVLHLVKQVNRLCLEKNIRPVGVSQVEFGVFALTMIRWDAVVSTAEELLGFRMRQGKAEPWKRDQALFDARAELRPHFDMRHTRDYADNAVRYFRTTGLLRLRGAGRYIDLEPVRKVEIDALLDEDDGSPVPYDPEIRYSDVLGNPTLPLLPWENHRELERIAVSLLDEIEKHVGEEEAVREDFSGKPIAEMKRLVEELRGRRNTIITEKAKSDLEKPGRIRENIDQLRGLLPRGHGEMQRSLALEWLATSGLIALNDAEEIRPNYPRGDDGKPRAHAPGGQPDIECYYDGFSSICEVTMSRDRMQWVHEGQPVMRHLRNFEDGPAKGTPAFALFIAPSIHRDTVNTFWNSVKHGYEGRPQRIVPLTIEQFCSILETCARLRETGRPISKDNIRELLLMLVGLTEDIDSSTEWIDLIPPAISRWAEATVGRQ